jgi:hypothetical protein
MSAKALMRKQPQSRLLPSSKLLINEHPLQVLPSLAVQVGLNEAIVLQQLHYWLLKSDNVYEGYHWVFNSYEQWQIQFPFWSVSTIQRIFTSLEKQSVVLSRRFDAQDWNQRKWYRIDYTKLNKLSDVELSN